MDFQSVKSLSEEVFTDLHNGEVRRLDIVLEMKIKKQDTFVIIHIEPQSSKQNNFHERKYLYYSLLYNKYRKPIIPIAVYTYDEILEQREYKMGFPFLNVLTFSFLTLHLRKMNWREYIKSDNPVAAALLSKMGYSENERIEVKKEFLRLLVKMEISPAKQRLIYGFFERYLKLDEEEEKLLMEEIKYLEDADKILEIPISYEEKGIEKGIRKVALEMLKDGMPKERVAKLTGLEKQELEKMHNDN